MNFRTFAAGIVAACAIIGCKSTGPDLAEDTAQAMRSLYKSLEEAPAKLESVTASLTELSKGEGDMRKQFDVFSKDVDALTSHRNQIRSLREKVNANRDQFQEAWNKRLAEIQDEELRNRAMERQQETVAAFGEITETAESAREMFEPWMQKVLDVRTYLENDLNPSGVASVSDKVKEINRGAGDINDAIENLLSELQGLATKIEATKPPPPPKEASGG
jgi:chromosome segregation ATPase